MVPICSEACKAARRAARAKRVNSTCSNCGVPVEVRGRLGLDQLRRGRAYCSEACKGEWMRRDRSQRMSATNRRYASARMTMRNPMRKPHLRARVSTTLRALGHAPHVRGGNGRGPTEPEITLALALPVGWQLGFVIPTRMPRGAGYPTHYKIDLAESNWRIAVEVDGWSHRALVRQEQDAKKEAWLQSRGWTVLRFTNQQIRADLARCVQTVLSITSRLKARTTTS